MGRTRHRAAPKEKIVKASCLRRGFAVMMAVGAPVLAALPATAAAAETYSGTIRFDRTFDLTVPTVWCPGGTEHRVWDEHWTVTASPGAATWYGRQGAVVEGSLNFTTTKICPGEARTFVETGKFSGSGPTALKVYAEDGAMRIDAGHVPGGFPGSYTSWDDSPTRASFYHPWMTTSMPVGADGRLSGTVPADVIFPPNVDDFHVKFPTGTHNATVELSRVVPAGPSQPTAPSSGAVPAGPAEPTGPSSGAPEASPTPLTIPSLRAPATVRTSATTKAVPAEIHASRTGRLLVRLRVKTGNRWVLSGRRVVSVRAGAWRSVALPLAPRLRGRALRAEISVQPCMSTAGCSLAGVRAQEKLKRAVRLRPAAPRRG
jgi:hypothetical protein